MSYLNLIEPTGVMTGLVMFEMSNMENIMNPFTERWKNFHNQLEIKILILLHFR